MLVGRIIGPGLFDPSCALIVKDKDDIRIPLILETIPSAKVCVCVSSLFLFTKKNKQKRRSSKKPFLLSRLSSSDSQKRIEECNWRARCLQCV
jgi:hypothetical protein